MIEFFYGVGVGLIVASVIMIGLTKERLRKERIKREEEWYNQKKKQEMFNP